MTTCYEREFTWYQRSTTKDTSSGQDQETFTTNGTLWGSCKEVSASKKLAYGITNNVVDYEIHLRQYPTVSSLDRLYDKYNSQMLVIKGLHYDRDNNETVIYAEHIQTVQVSTS